MKAESKPVADASPKGVGRWWRTILALVLLGLMAVVLVFSRDREPAYGGHTLSEWVHRYQGFEVSADTPETREVVDAIRRIGTNHLPELITLLAYDPSPRRHRVAVIGHALPHFLRSPVLMEPLLTDQKEFRADTARTALAVLGPEARRALPELVRLVDATNSGICSRRAMWVLVNLGPPGMPPLLNLITNGPHPNRVFAVDYIGDFGTNASAAIPALTAALQDPALVVRLKATNSLRKISPGIRIPPD